jgi:hypothetical protein
VTAVAQRARARQRTRCSGGGGASIGGGGHQPDMVAVAGAHPSERATARGGGECSFGNVLEHPEANEGGEVRSGRDG